MQLTTLGDISALLHGSASLSMNRNSRLTALWKGRPWRKFGNTTAMSLYSLQLCKKNSAIVPDICARNYPLTIGSSLPHSGDENEVLSVSSLPWVQRHYSWWRTINCRIWLWLLRICSFQKRKISLRWWTTGYMWQASVHIGLIL